MGNTRDEINYIYTQFKTSCILKLNYYLKFSTRKLFGGYSWNGIANAGKNRSKRFHYFLTIRLNFWEAVMLYVVPRDFKKKKLRLTIEISRTTFWNTYSGNVGISYDLNVFQREQFKTKQDVPKQIKTITILCGLYYFLILSSFIVRCLAIIFLAIVNFNHQQRWTIKELYII